MRVQYFILGTRFETIQEFGDISKTPVNIYCYIREVLGVGEVEET